MKRLLILTFLVVSPAFAQGTRTEQNEQLKNWKLEIQARIQRAWVKPASARIDLNCVVYLTQSPEGQVLNVRLGQCNGDPAVRGSIQAAAFRASPLPPPPEPALFARSLEITFNPADASAAHFLTEASTLARKQAQAQASTAGVASAPEFTQDAGGNKARGGQTKEDDLYAIIFHYLTLNPTIPVVFAIVGPLPADHCAAALATLEQVAGLPPGYRSASRCGNRQVADQTAATYQCHVIDQQSVNVAELPGAIQYVYSCQGPPFVN
jgi:hypothetical protein